MGSTGASPMQYFPQSLNLGVSGQCTACFERRVPHAPQMEPLGCLVCLISGACAPSAVHSVEIPGWPGPAKMAPAMPCVSAVLWVYKPKRNYHVTASDDTCCIQFHENELRRAPRGNVTGRPVSGRASVGRTSRMGKLYSGRALCFEYSKMGARWPLYEALSYSCILFRISDSFGEQSRRILHVSVPRPRPVGVSDAAGAPSPAPTPPSSPSPSPVATTPSPATLYPRPYRPRLASPLLAVNSQSDRGVTAGGSRRKLVDPERDGVSCGGHRGLVFVGLDGYCTGTWWTELRAKVHALV